MHIVVASKNPVKLEAARRGVGRMFPDATVEVIGVSVPSGVSDQPMCDAETRRGARQRALAARALVAPDATPPARFWLGLEGGLDTDPEGRLHAFAWVAILGAARDTDRPTERWGESRTATFELPPAVANLVRQGMELGAADDVVFGREGSKAEEGAVGLVTGGRLDRAGLYAPAVSLALVPFLQPDLYGDRGAGTA